LNTFPTFGDRDYRFGGILGIGYGYWFDQHWGLSLGAEIGLYNMKMQVNDLIDDYTTIDPDGEDIRYLTQVEGYTEKERLYQLNIPLQAWFKTKINGRGDELYVSLGGKFGVPLSAKYTSKNAEFQTAGYYSSTNQTLYDQRDLGYGDNTGKTLKENLNFNFSYIGSAEAGIKWKLENPRYNLYTGFYFDYGFNDILKKNDNTFLEYDQYNPERFRTNSILTSQYTNNGETNSFADKLSVVSLGIKVRLGFNLCHIEKDANKKEDAEKEQSASEKSKKVDSKNNDSTGGVHPSYRRGYRDGYGDSAEDYVDYSKPRRQSRTPENDPLVAAEMRRAAGEYGKLKDTRVLQVAGYELNQAELSSDLQARLNDIIADLAQYNNDKYLIIVEGHTCDLGREDFNLQLAQERAEIVKQYLLGKGFKSDNVIPVSKGKLTPVVPNTSEDNRKINRRVVFLIKEKR
jgi:outer membrane protein OmpA-like peptidoglycan-associated protein